MVESIVLKAKKQPTVSLSTEILHHKLSIAIEQFIPEEFISFDLKIVFKEPIVAFRNHDYTWVNCTTDCIAGKYAPKIIKLANGTIIQPNVTAGIWEVQKSNPKVLLWRFNPPNAYPLTVYTGRQNERVVEGANQMVVLNEPLALLFSDKSSIEFSRSPIPFAAVACFTDHCDFDTLESLKLQRAFFKQTNIKVTKGFFLNHFSKRDDNASWEVHQQEFEKWKQDGHELAYHSLSQSLKNKAESFTDFQNFIPPLEEVPTWIDHGFQPYNFSLYRNYGKTDLAYSTNLAEKKITNLWNYIDSGTSSLGVINQLNPNDFTLNSFYNGIKTLSFRSKASQLIKNILFHYYANEKLIHNYKATAESFKQLVFQKKIGASFKLLKNACSISIPLLKVFLFWDSHKNKPYKLAKYTPLVFNHTILNNEFTIFQTLEMVDFKKSLHPKAIDKLIDENGMFIAHTYFSVPLEYHEGRMFKSNTEIDERVNANFTYLGEKIKDQQIWNPTLNELVLFLANFDKLVLDIDTSGTIIVRHQADIPYRILNE